MSRAKWARRIAHAEEYVKYQDHGFGFDENLEINVARNDDNDARVTEKFFWYFFAPLRAFNKCMTSEDEFDVIRACDDNPIAQLLHLVDDPGYDPELEEEDDANEDGVTEIDDEDDDESRPPMRIVRVPDIGGNPQNESEDGLYRGNLIEVPRDDPEYDDWASVARSDDESDDVPDDESGVTSISNPSTLPAEPNYTSIRVARLTRQRRNPRLVVKMVRKAKIKFGVPTHSVANELAIRRYVMREMKESNVRDVDMQRCIKTITSLVFIPTNNEIHTSRIFLDPGIQARRAAYIVTDESK